ncbi:MAG: alpha/beta fold hydrolase, partial [Sphingomonadales bacterium]|nr:alpha/beta fold hydrolase [Sphingomonadales bacterium]
LVMGPGSWGWVERAYASMRRLADPALLAQVKCPVLIVATDNDRLVGYRAIEHAATALPDVRLVNYGKAAHHEVLREADAVRDRVLAETDALLARIAG